MTRAMILAAGRGERMGDLTRVTPKPLLKVAGRYLIEYAIGSLQRAGIQEIVINTAHLGEQIEAALGDGKQYAVSIVYSHESERLETGGGITQALSLLGDEPFIVMSSDIITDYALQHLPKHPENLAHLVLVNNPSFHPEGDFGLQDNQVSRAAKPWYTFSNIGIYRKELFAGCKVAHFPLNRVLFPAIKKGLVTGERYEGVWVNVGTPLQLAAINMRAREDSNLRPLASETNTLSN